MHLDVCFYVGILCTSRFELGWAHDNIFVASHMIMHYSCISTFHFLPFGTICWLVVFYLSLSLSLSLSDSLRMAPKCKTTPSRNPLHSKASSSDSTPLFVRFRDDKACQDFSKNFSKHGIHSDCHVILSDFSYIDLLTGHSQAGIRVSLWDLGELSLRDHTGVLLQYAWIWFFSTSVFYLHSRYAHYGHSEYCIWGAPCPEGSTSWLPQLWLSKEHVQRRAYVFVLWDSFCLGWSSEHPLLNLC